MTTPTTRAEYFDLNGLSIVRRVNSIMSEDYGDAMRVPEVNGRVLEYRNAHQQFLVVLGGTRARVFSFVEELHLTNMESKHG